MAINSKNKGNSFERKIAKALSERFAEFTGLETSFRRNADSGSFFGGKNKSRTDTHDLEKATFGDLICPSRFRFTIECKHYKTPPSFASLLNQNNRQFDEWLSQARQDAEAADRHALVVVKFNNVPEFVMLDPTVWGPAAMAYRDFVMVPMVEFLARDDEFFFDHVD